ncbi:alpha/beta fold hydrolase [Nocardioides xinjiangensis]|uniref:alpha/beta fold hydrolase n=1 Tax=Nocardioides xinjiangensis TaxID=2817376 RepID=UPI001B30C256|nr:alpha/beta hydrolase [Nocardioides sp. SYSU D00778]
MPVELLCVPGLGLEAAEWRAAGDAIGRRVGARRTTLRPLPGYGLRPDVGDDLRPRALAERLVAELPERAVLLGHSASCQVVTRAAALAPGSVSALVLVGPTTDPRAASWPRLAARWLRTAAWERPHQVPVLARSYSRTGLGWMARAMEAARREDVRADLRSLTCPVLVVRGRHDRICPEDWSGHLASLAPDGSRAVTLARGGHMVPLTHPDLLSDAVASWLRASGA